MFREAFYISITFLNVLISPKFEKSNHVYRCRDKADKFKQGWCNSFNDNWQKDNKKVIFPHILPYCVQETGSNNYHLYTYLYLSVGWEGTMKHELFHKQIQFISNYNIKQSLLKLYFIFPIMPLKCICQLVAFWIHSETLTLEICRRNNSLAFSHKEIYRCVQIRLFLQA